MTTSMHATDQGMAGSALYSVGAATAHKLPRAGARPLVFHGSELAMAMSFSPALPYWFEINLYRTDSQDFVVAIRKFFQSETETDRANAWSFPDVESALAHIETYDPAIGVEVPDLDFEAMAPAEMSAAALSLKAEVDGVRHHYAGLVGELFMEIEAVDDSIG